MEKKRIGIGFMTCNKLNWTKKCIAALEKYTPLDKVRILILDNGSTDGTVEYLKTTKYQICFEDENIGITKGTNKIWKEFLKDPDIEYVTRIHNDVVVTENWIENMLNIIQVDPKLGRVGIAQVVGENIIDLEIEEINEICQKYRRNKTGYANLDPVMFPRQMLVEVGLLDEGFGKQSCSDCDHNKRMEDAGWGVLCTDDIVVGHGERATRKYLENARDIEQAAISYWNKKYPGVDREKYNKVTYRDIVEGKKAIRIKGV